VPESKVDLVFHPVRIRILQALIRGEELTAGQLGERLPDVPPATLYRHLNKLTAAEMIIVVEERPVRGVVERVYAAPIEAAALAPEEMAEASRADHLRYFTIFLASLLGEFSRYLEREEVDFVADGVGYRQFPLYLDDAEFEQLIGELNALLLRALEKEPRADRTRRMLTRIILPSSEASTRNQGDENDDR
jgi:DNA-binding transcriptional ArsR family regulator